jgi:hypothetical protein
MKKYYHRDTFEIYDISDHLFNFWVNSKHPKSKAFILLPDPPEYDDFFEHPPVFEKGLWIKRKKTKQEIAENMNRKRLNVLLDLLSRKDLNSDEKIDYVTEAAVLLIKKSLDNGSS